LIHQLRKPFRTFSDLVSRYTKQLSEYHGLLYNPKVSVLTKGRVIKSLGDSWLEVAFGLRPAMSDARDIAEAIARHSYDQRREVARGSDRRLQNRIINRSFAFSVPGFTANRTYDEEAFGSVMYAAYMDWSNGAAFGSAERLVELSGFRPDLFIPTLYELTPWSWLVDYVSNLGTVIETGCQAQTQVKFVVRSQKLETVTTTTTDFDKSPGIDTLTQSPGIYKVRFTNFSRGDASTKLPSVPFVMEVPEKATQYLNLLALWASRQKP